MNEEQSYFLRDINVILNTYKRIPVEISHGEGVYLFSKDGRKYLDFFSGLAVNALGYNHPGVIAAINEQLSKYIHLSNYYLNDSQIRLAELLIKHTGMAGVFFTNSGTEAVEAALKLIRKSMGPDKEIISLVNSFHGRTYGALSLTGRDKYKEAFLPMLPKIHQIKFNDVNDLINNINEETAAIFVEFIQGEGGIKLLSNEFVESLNDLREKFNFIIVADEIQSGLGRTGKPFAFNYFDINPDILLIAKALGGGLPLGAVLAVKKYKDVFSSGDHGTTFGGNPVACAAGIAVLEEIFGKKLVEKVSELGNYFLFGLNFLKNNFPDKIKDVRGRGFMLGVEMNFECSKIVELLRNRGILVNCTNSFVVRILPPLIAQKEHIDFFLYNLDETLKSI